MAKRMVVKKEEEKKVVCLEATYVKDSPKSHRYNITEIDGIRFFQGCIYVSKDGVVPGEITIKLKVA